MKRNQGEEALAGGNPLKMGEQIYSQHVLRKIFGGVVAERWGAERERSGLVGYHLHSVIIFDDRD